MIFFIKNNHKLIISFAILILVSLSIFHFKNKHREIIDGPDDKYHYLIKRKFKILQGEKCFCNNFNKYQKLIN